MTALAWLFPGQGSQKVGMGAELLASDPELMARYLDLADEASGQPVRATCLDGPAELLTRTDVAQPALFSVCLALAEIAAELGLRPDFVAGHSLGEYTAAAAAGALGVDPGMRAVAERGRLMNVIQDERPGAMAAIIGLDAEAVRVLCDDAAELGIAQLANLNSPTQIVVSGEVAAIEDVIERATAAGAKRAVRLQVGAAFHSSLMEPVREQMRALLEELEFDDAEPPLAANCSAKLVSEGAEVRDALVTQIASPVRWADCVALLRSAGATHFLELGPGRVLSGLVRQIDPEAEVVSCDSRAKLEEFAAETPRLVRAA
jgi:[acyl-carrier-protein] S-malonyltransferase